MKNRITPAASLFMALALCLSLLPAPALAADSGVTVWNDSIGGSSARIVSVSMAGRTGQISLANNSVVEAAKPQTLIDSVNNQGSHVVAAVNGGFFNSYTTGAQVFPTNCAMIADAVVVNRQLVHTGRSSILGFAADGTPMIDWVTLRAKVELGNGFTPLIWSVNTYENDPGAIMLFDEHLTLPVAIPSSATMFYIRDGKITQSAPGGTITVPAGTQVLVYGSAVMAEETGYYRAPEVGMDARVTFSASGTSRDAAWEQVQTALSGGPILVKNGVNVVDHENNGVYYGDPKQRPDVTAGRTFVGIKNGTLVMGTVSSTFRKIADWMVAQGIQDGIAMDGGASSMLYANGAFVAPAGRNLASVLTIVEKSGAAVQPVQPAVNLDEPSAWAQADVSAAISLGLVPENLRTGYQRSISRKNFCILTWELIKKDPNYMEKMLWNRPEVSFSDTDQAEVLWCAQAGIIDGVGGGRFNPNGELTREQAAKILAITMQKLGVPGSSQPVSFTDRAAFSSWAASYIDYCAALGVLKGRENGAFDPGGKLSGQEAVVIMLRICGDYVGKY